MVAAPDVKAVAFAFEELSEAEASKILCGSDGEIAVLLIDSVKRQMVHAWEFRIWSIILKGEHFLEKHLAT